MRRGRSAVNIRAALEGAPNRGENWIDWVGLGVAVLALAGLAARLVT